MNPTSIYCSVAIMFLAAFNVSDSVARRATNTFIDKDTIIQEHTAKISAVKIFHSIDFNKDWIITEEEVKEKFHLQHRLTKFFKAADVNEDGKITYGEFFNIKNRLLKDFKFIKIEDTHFSASAGADSTGKFIEDYGLLIGIIALSILLACFKFI